MNQKQPIILASASPRRLEIMLHAGYAVQVQPADIVEEQLPNETPEAMVARLAQAKAKMAAAHYPEAIILGADTIVLHRQRAMGKPANLQQARNMLAQLSNSEHQVLTGICLYRQKPAWNDTWVCRTTVRFRQLSEPRIEQYLSKVNPLDKAGAYAIQEFGEMLVENFTGLRSNVIGLPIEEVRQHLGNVPEA